MKESKNSILDIPRVTPNPLTKSGRTISATWIYDAGCVQDITVDHYQLCWDVSISVLIGSVTRTYCRTTSDGGTSASFDVPLYIPTWNSVTLRTVAIKPNDIAYGSDRILEWLRNTLAAIPLPLPQVLSEIIDRQNVVPITPYYDEQEVNLTIER